MAKFKRLADVLETQTWDVSDSANWEDYKLAAVIDIMVSLRAIRRVLECGNVQRSALSMQALERLAREFWVKPTPRKYRKKASPAPEVPRGR